jgi:hypothetical protein
VEVASVSAPKDDSTTSLVSVAPRGRRSSPHSAGAGVDVYSPMAKLAAWTPRLPNRGEPERSRHAVATKILVVYYSLHGHVETLAGAVAITTTQRPVEARAYVGEAE